jgi:glycine oxidase
MFAARDGYPAFLAGLAERTGIRVPTAEGVVEVARNDVHFEELRVRARRLTTAHLLDAGELALLEPALAPARGAILHERDGAVDVATLLVALRAAIQGDPRVTVRFTDAASLERLDSSRPRLRLADGSIVDTSHVVLASGAWAPALPGLPRVLPVRPLKGEIAIAPRRGPRRVVFGAGGYVVPRGDELLLGATSEDVGFDATVSQSAAAALDAIARTLLAGWPADGATFTAQRAGLRPVTPDLLPIIGAEPDLLALVYACGYSRNGVLVAPLAGECVAAIVAGAEPGFDLAPFSIGRFARN